MKRYNFKIPVENEDYPLWSDYAVSQISAIVKKAIDGGRNQILISTNLRRGLPLENINKVAGPFVEAWALETFEDISSNPDNEYRLIHVEAGARLDPYDVILQFKRVNDKETYISSNVDVKATAEDIPTSGKSPNIVSYSRIRTAYVEDPDYIFIILSLKHKVYSEKDKKTGMTNGVMEIRSHSVYDVKYISEKDLNYNPALGTGQLQVRDIHYVETVRRTTWQFCQIFDQRFIASKGQAAFEKLAHKHEWIK